MHVETFGARDGIRCCSPARRRRRRMDVGAVAHPSRRGRRVIVPDLPVTDAAQTRPMSLTRRRPRHSPACWSRRAEQRPSWVLARGAADRAARRAASRPREECRRHQRAGRADAGNPPHTRAPVRDGGTAKREWFARAQARQLFVPDELLDEYLQASGTISRETLLRSVEENLRFAPPDTWRSYPGAASILVGAKERSLMKRSAALLHASLPPQRPGSRRRVRTRYPAAAARMARAPHRRDVRRPSRRR